MGIWDVLIYFQIWGKNIYTFISRWVSPRLKIFFLFKKNFFLTFIYFWDRERQSMNRGGAETEGDTESETGCRLWAVSTEPDAGLELTGRPWDHVLSWSWSLNRLSHSRTPNTERFVKKGSNMKQSVFPAITVHNSWRMNWRVAPRIEMGEFGSKASV